MKISIRYKWYLPIFIAKMLFIALMFYLIHYRFVISFASYVNTYHLMNT